jgi:hypothetical protein
MRSALESFGVVRLNERKQVARLSSQGVARTLSAAPARGVGRSSSESSITIRHPKSTQLRGAALMLKSRRVKRSLCSARLVREQWRCCRGMKADSPRQRAHPSGRAVFSIHPVSRPSTRNGGGVLPSPSPRRSPDGTRCTSVARSRGGLGPSLVSRVSALAFAASVSPGVSVISRDSSINSVRHGNRTLRPHANEVRGLGAP